MTGAKRRGRRPDSSRTREVILAQALQSFIDKGFHGTSLRGVAAAAGVDDGTVRHHFGDKVGLLLAALQISVDPRKVIEKVAAGGTDGLGPRIIRTAVTLYDSPLAGAVIDAFKANPKSAPVLGTVLTEQMLRHAERLFPDVPPRVRRGRLLVIQDMIGGLFLGRVLLGEGPVAEASPDELVAHLGPMLQAAIDGRLEHRPHDLK